MGKKLKKIEERLEKELEGLENFKRIYKIGGQLGNSYSYNPNPELRDREQSFENIQIMLKYESYRYFTPSIFIGLNGKKDIPYLHMFPLAASGCKTSLIKRHILKSILQNRIQEYKEINPHPILNPEKPLDKVNKNQLYFYEDIERNILSSIYLFGNFNNEKPLVASIHTINNILNDYCLIENKHELEIQNLENEETQVNKEYEKNITNAHEQYDSIKREKLKELQSKNGQYGSIKQDKLKELQSKIKGILPSYCR